LLCWFAKQKASGRVDGRSNESVGFQVLVIWKAKKGAHVDHADPVKGTFPANPQESLLLRIKKFVPNPRAG
jgi:hypothetical protein